MVIGAVNRKEIEISSGENKKLHKYLEMIIRQPFMQSETFTITQNKKKETQNHPDWIINYSFNRKGETYNRSRVGAIWDKQKDDLHYKTGYIESQALPNGRLSFSMFPAKPIAEQDPKKITWLYDVVANNYNADSDNNADSETNTISTNVEYKDIEIIDMDEIPF